MGKRSSKLPSPATAIALVALFVALGGTGYAVVNGSGIPDRSGVFHGCVDRRTGALRVVASAGACHRARRTGRHRVLGEFAISWSQKGSPGLPGRNGLNGVNGINGINGINGTDGANGTAIAYASINMPGNVDPTNSKNIPVGSVRVHNDNYCFTDVGFVPHVVAVTPQRVSVAVSPSVTTDLTTTEWNFTCGSGTPKSPGSFVVQLFKPDNSQTTADFTVTVN